MLRKRRSFARVHLPAFVSGSNTLLLRRLLQNIADNHIAWTDVHQLTCHQAIFNTATSHNQYVGFKGLTNAQSNMRHTSVLQY